MGRRARAADLASQAGLGDVHHLHRERRAAVSLFTLTGRVGVFTFAGAGLLATHGHILAGLTVVAMAVGGVTAYRYGAPLTGPRRRIAVCRDGLLLTCDHDEPVALRWGTVQTRPFIRVTLLPGLYGPPTVSRTVSQVAYLDHRGTPRVFEVDMFSRTGPLLRSIETGAPATMSRTPEIIGSLGTAAMLGLIVWLLVLPRYVTHQEDRLPTSMSGLSVACQPPGTAFHAAPAFAGPAPHPVAVYFRDVQLTNLDPTSSVAWQPELPGSVQLIACVTEVSGYPGFAGLGPKCTYSTQLGLATQTVAVIETNYRIDLYELRSHRKLASTTTVGQDKSCPADPRSGSTIPSRLSTDQYRDILRPYVRR